MIGWTADERTDGRGRTVARTNGRSWATGWTYERTAARTDARARHVQNCPDGRSRCRIHGYILEKREGYTNEYVMAADGKKISVSPDQILAEIPIKNHKPDRMTLVMRFSSESVNMVKSLWKDVQENGIMDSADLQALQAKNAKGTKRTKEDEPAHLVLTKAKCSKGIEGKAFLEKFFVQEIPKHFRGVWEKDISETF